MKKLFLTILCGVGLSLNFVVADTTANLPKETYWEKLEKNIPNLPKTEQEKLQLNEFFIALENDDANKIKSILSNNPKIINLLQDVEGGKISFLAELIRSEDSSERKIKAISNFSKFFGLDLNQICMVAESKNEKLFYFYYPLSYILILDKDGETYFDLFKFFAKNRTNTTNALNYTLYKIQNENKIDLEKFIRSSEYKNIREKYKKYIYEIFNNYSIDDFSNLEIILTGRDFISLNDIEFMKLLIDSGLKKNEIAYNEILKFANDKNASKEILDLLK